MLVKCKECGKEVSNQAATCPSCGVKIKEVQTVEQTGKRWKKMELFGGLIFFVGVGSCCILLAGGGEGMEFTAIPMISGVILCIIAKIGAWWCHG